MTGISRVESLGAAANIFVGQSEIPLVIQPYLANLPPSQLFTVMTVGMAGVAGTILAAYASMLGASYLPYLLAATFMSAPGGILMAKIIMPDDLPARRAPLEGGEPARTRSTSPRRSRRASARPTSSWPPPRARRPASSSRSRSARWCWPSSPWSRSPTACSAGSAIWFGLPDLSFQRLLGYVFQPVMFMLSVPWNEAGDRRRPVRHQGGAQRVRRLHRPRRRCGAAALATAAARSSPSRCAASPISARSRSRWR